MTQEKTASVRVHFIDEIRGFAILCMVVYHFFFDLVVCFGVDIPLFYSPVIRFLVDFFVVVFVFISGAACAFSRNNLKRGIKCFLFGMILTIGTLIFAKDLAIWFGILHMLGVCMMLAGLLEKPLKKIPVWGLLVGGLALYMLTYHVADGYLGFDGIFKISLPQSLYETNMLVPLGFVPSDFHSSDFFPLFPWLFCFIAGIGLGRLLQEKKMPAVFYQAHLKPLAFVGRHTIWIYLLHQPILIGILYLFFMFVK